MKKLIPLLAWGLLIVNVSANFEESKNCQRCHPVIYDEFYTSSHRKSSVYDDSIHKAVWDKHPLKAKEKYSCAKCHTPSDKELLKKLDTGESALPRDNEAQREGVSCVSCHTIDHIEEHSKTNINKFSTKKRTFFSAKEGKESERDISFSKKSSFFGLITEKSGSPYHKIDYSNKNFYDGKMCLGCHSHKQNAHKLEVCRTDIKAVQGNKENCISCHMPMVQGTMNTVHETSTHRYHGFAGTANRPEMLSPYVKLNLKRSDSGFIITVKNKANHPLFLHPLRLAQLRVSVRREDKTTTLEPVSFLRIIGKDGKPSMPWIADSVVKDTQIQPGESRDISFAFKLKKGDTVEARMGFYRVNPKAAKKLGLTADNSLSSFTLLKKELFQIGE